MSVLESIHAARVYGRRVRVLGEWMARLLPRGASILDVGAGDGVIDELILRRRGDVSILGLDVLARPATRIPVEAFDGRTIPHPDASFDVVMFVDVLHHTPDPIRLLQEARRASRRWVLLKDHTRDGPLAGITLRFMDWVGNARHGVSLPYNFWPSRQWREALGGLGLSIRQWETRLGLYPAYANWLFGRSLHFVALLERSGAG